MVPRTPPGCPGHPTWRLHSGSLLAGCRNQVLGQMTAFELFAPTSLFRREESPQHPAGHQHPALVPPAGSAYQQTYAVASFEYRCEDWKHDQFGQYWSMWEEDWNNAVRFTEWAKESISGPLRAEDLVTTIEPRLHWRLWKTYRHVFEIEWLDLSACRNWRRPRKTSRGCSGTPRRRTGKLGNS